MANADSSSTENPHFHQIERAPYELGHLLLKMPPDFSMFSKPSPESQLIAQAARQHAMNGSYTLLSGLEALGQCMFVAGANEENDVDKRSFRDLGCLISHLAVEIQFLHETELMIGEALAAHTELDTEDVVGVRDDLKKNAPNQKNGGAK